MHSNTLATSPSGALVASACDRTASPPGPTRFARGPRVTGHWLGPARPRCGPVTGLTSMCCDCTRTCKNGVSLRALLRSSSDSSTEKRRGATGPPSAFSASPRHFKCAKCHLGACHQPVKTDMRSVKMAHLTTHDACRDAHGHAVCHKRPCGGQKCGTMDD